MGKYFTKPQINVDVSVMEVSQPHLGVRTRAKTLALQRLQSTPPPPPPPPPTPVSGYLQLRSRRLEKSSPTLLNNDPKKCPSYRPKHTRKESKSDPRDETSKPRSNSRSRLSSHVSGSVGSVSISHSDTEEMISQVPNGRETETDTDRSTRGSSPCSLAREADTMASPGSTTRLANLNMAVQIRRNFVLRNTPSAHELDEFFNFAEQQQQHLFVDKYNFDVVNDSPLPGRYEWIRVNY